jgi:hypothetical protein
MIQGLVLGEKKTLLKTDALQKIEIILKDNSVKTIDNIKHKGEFDIVSTKMHSFKENKNIEKISIIFKENDNVKKEDYIEDVKEVRVFAEINYNLTVENSNINFEIIE